jgi:hypothetical protein
VRFDTPSQLTTIPDECFNRCKCLTTLTLLDFVTSYSPSAFCDSGITSLIIPDCTISTGVIVRLGKVYGRETSSSLRIPGNIHEIGDGVFCLEPQLMDLSFEEGTLKIGVSAFHHCSTLEKAAFPASLIVIEATAFQLCDRLRRITFAVGSQLQYVRSEAFEYCPLS